MASLHETERDYLERARHIPLAELDYNLVLKQKSHGTFVLVGLGSSFLLLGLLLFIVELLPGLRGLGNAAVIVSLLAGLALFFQAVRHQRQMETLAAYEVFQRIKAIEGREGFLWRIGNSLNAYCQETYGGIPDEVLQLQTSSQAGGIDVNEIRLYKDLLERVVAWHQGRNEH
ncbi:hypothetical protein [Desulfuromonas thiophila]|uniref:Uncharacterized protein n=1 Tax=Desulfuromonas thiophila TaxID=57664 RepID=A0A1G7CFH9_9BACT|nr:hypothetical protein [Desulfuromonas thiophila]SDE38144.1 hypothetical protein SAMN05661003_10974 [Desulfuromonas thiophila]